MPWYCGYEPDSDYDYVNYSVMEYDGHIYDVETGEEIAQVLNEETALRIVDLHNATETAETAGQKPLAAAAPREPDPPKRNGGYIELNYQLCHTCGAKLTQGQFAYSRHRFGRPLCPNHQPRTAAAA